MLERGDPEHKKVSVFDYLVPVGVALVLDTG